MIEATCGRCGETFNPAGASDVVHVVRADGVECDGVGTITGSAVYGAEADVRAFAEQFPTPEVRRALALCVDGTLEWSCVADLFKAGLVKALDTAQADRDRRIADANDRDMAATNRVAAAREALNKARYELAEAEADARITTAELVALVKPGKVAG